MKALQFAGLDRPLEVVDIPKPTAGEGEVLVEIKAAAFNRRDYWIQQGQYPRIEFPVVPGSDASGICDGREVVIDAGIGWGEKDRTQDKSFHLIGVPGQGVFAEYIAMPRENIYDKPAHLTWEEAAAIPVAGVTAYRALFTRGEAQRGEKLLITGGGGGVAVMALQFALAAGLEVFVTTGSREKLQRLVELGASGGAIYKEEQWIDDLKNIAGGFDMVLDGTGGDGFSKVARLVRPGGRLLVYGGSLGKINGLSPQHLFWRQVDIRGTSMGSPRDFAAMIDFINSHQIRPVVDSVFSMNDANQALRRIAESNQIGKVVLTISE